MGPLAFLLHPAVLSTIAGALPSIISALVGSPTEAQAKAKVAPEREEMIRTLINGGLKASRSEAIADELIAGKVREEMNKGGVPPWLEGALSIGGALGGWKAGSWLTGKYVKGLGGLAAKGAAVEKGIPHAPGDASTDTIDTVRGMAPIKDPGAAAAAAVPKNAGVPVRPPPSAIDASAETAADLRPWAGAPPVRQEAEKFGARSPFYSPEPRPLDPLTGAPRGSRGRYNTLTGTNDPTDEVRTLEQSDLGGPFFKRDPMTGGRAYTPEESMGFEVANRYVEPAADAAARRAAMEELDAIEAARKQSQMNAMRVRDESIRGRGTFGEGLQTQPGNTGF
jgi:hypothetical protein